MPAFEETNENETSPRLTFRQKFWLFGVGVPVLLIIVLLAVVVILPRPLNPTEQKLLGRWRLVDPVTAKGNEIIFDETYLSSSVTPDLYLWEADENSFSMMVPERGELISRLELWLGFSFPQDRFQIIDLSENHLRLRSTYLGDDMTFERVPTVSL